MRPVVLEPDTFWIRDLRFAGIHLSLVRNDHLAGLLESHVGWFLAWDQRWLAGTLRVRSICLNIDVDWR
jgi:hypothetical protein